MRPRTEAGLERRNSATWSGVGRPVAATDRYARQTSGANRPHEGLGAVPAGAVGPGRGVVLLKNSPAHARLNTPASGPAPVASGRNALARSFHVISGTIASTRWSYPARSRASAPP